MTPMTDERLEFEVWANPENGWHLYRSFSDAKSRDWYFERLPDEDARAFRIVNHPSRFIIAARDNYGAREA